MFPLPGSEGRILTFKIDYVFESGEDYYILIDGGMVGRELLSSNEYRVMIATLYSIE